jgi:hypothetical protein
MGYRRQFLRVRRYRPLFPLNNQKPDIGTNGGIGPAHSRRQEITPEKRDK